MDMDGRRSAGRRQLTRVRSMAKPKRGRSTAAIDDHVGGRIREPRLILGLTQKQLAEMIDVTYLSSTGRRNSSVRRFHKLVQSLGRCSPSKRLARTTIQRCRHGGKRVDAVHAQVRALRKVLAQ